MTSVNPSPIPENVGRGVETVGQIRERARRDASGVLGAFWDGNLPIDPVSMARAAGTSVFTAQLGNDVYGMIVGSGSSADIYVDVDQPPARFRFTTAHELGHYIDHTVRGESLGEAAGYVDQRSENGRGQPAEIYANEFAASLLMPEQKVGELTKQKKTIFEMAKSFEVSVSAMAWRLHRLGIELETAGHGE